MLTVLGILIEKKNFQYNVFAEMGRPMRIVL